MSDEIVINNMRVSRAVYPLLYQDLNQLSHKPRAERFRSLAFVGFLIARSRVDIVPIDSGGSTLPAPGEPFEELLLPKVRIHHEAYPELITDIGRLPPKQRTERFRALASIGLLVLSGRFQIRTSGVSPGTPSKAQPGPKDDRDSRPQTVPGPTGAADDTPTILQDGLVSATGAGSTVPVTGASGSAGEKVTGKGADSIGSEVNPRSDIEQPAEQSQEAQELRTKLMSKARKGMF